MEEKVKRSKMITSEKIKEWLEKKKISIKINPAVTFFGVLTLQWGNLDINITKWSKEDKDKIDSFLRNELKITIGEFKDFWNDEIKRTNREEIERVLKTIQDSKDDILEGILHTKEQVLHELKQIQYSLENYGYVTFPKVSLRQVSQSNLVFLRIRGSVFSNKRGEEMDFSKISQIAKIVKKHYDKGYNFVIFTGLGFSVHEQFKDFFQDLDGFYSAKIPILDVFKSQLRINMTKLYNFFAKENIPIVLLFPSAEVVTSNGKIKSGLDNLLNVISLGNIPLIMGDIVYDTKRDATILSADALMSYSLKKIKPRKVIIATDIDGIYGGIPWHDNAKLIRELTLETLEDLKKELYKETIGKTIGIDITSWMLCKIDLLTEIAKRDIDIFIVNGKNPERVEKILNNKNTICTHIHK